MRRANKKSLSPSMLLLYLLSHQTRRVDKKKF